MKTRWIKLKNRFNYRLLFRNTHLAKSFHSTHSAHWDACSLPQRRKKRNTALLVQNIMKARHKCLVLRWCSKRMKSDGKLWIITYTIDTCTYIRNVWMPREVYKDGRILGHHGVGMVYDNQNGQKTQKESGTMKHILVFKWRCPWVKSEGKWQIRTLTIGT